MAPLLDFTAQRKSLESAERPLESDRKGLCVHGANDKFNRERSNVMRERERVLIFFFSFYIPGHTRHPCAGFSCTRSACTRMLRIKGVRAYLCYLRLYVPAGPGRHGGPRNLTRGDPSRRRREESAKRKKSEVFTFSTVYVRAARRP